MVTLLPSTVRSCDARPKLPYTPILENLKKKRAVYYHHVTWTNLRSSFKIVISVVPKLGVGHSSTFSGTSDELHSTDFSQAKAWSVRYKASCIG